MKKIIKYLSIVLLVFCCTSGALGVWNGTFHVVVQEGHCDCGDTNEWSGTVAIATSLDNDNAVWQGYTTYTFYLTADVPGGVDANVLVLNSNDPADFCYGSDDESWSSMPSSTVIQLDILTDPI